MPSRPCPPTVGAQRGAVLIVALIFLLLITLIGISSMRNATLQEKMTAGLAFRNNSFQLAESALRRGETAVAAASYNLATCTPAVCAPPSDSGAVTVAGAGSNGVTWFNPDTGVIYGVQKLGTSTGAVSLAGTSATLYRITGVGIAGQSRTVLESIYAKY